MSFWFYPFFLFSTPLAPFWHSLVLVYQDEIAFFSPISEDFLPRIVAAVIRRPRNPILDFFFGFSNGG